VTTTPQAPATELVGVYHADGSLLGELRYALGKVTGRAHCALCDTTHSGVRRRREWGALVDRLPVPFRLVHLDERDDDVRAASEGATPLVLARADGRLVPVLGARELEQVAGDVPAFERLLLARLEALGLLRR
jgi:hypothetical protein